jgi:uncharacterized membrane protein YdjX (TVP38/TMEM64 family)
MRKLAICLILLIAAIVMPFVFFEAQSRAWSEAALSVAGDPITAGIVVAALLTLDVLLPIPSSVVSATAGALLGVVAGTAASTTGMTLGCVAGYWVGAVWLRDGLAHLVSEHELARAERLVDRLGTRALVLFRAIPVLAEATVIAAGVARMRFGRFALATLIPNFGISAAYATGGDAMRRVTTIQLVSGILLLVTVATFTIRAARRMR